MLEIKLFLIGERVFLDDVKSYNTNVSHPRCEHFYRLLSSRCDTEKDGGKGKGHWIDNRNKVNSCAAWGYSGSHGLRKERSAYQSPPPPTLPQEDYGQILATSPKVEDGLQSGVCEDGSRIWKATVITHEFSVQ